MPQISWLRSWFNSSKSRTIGFLMAFFVIGNVLQIVHRLDTNYIAFMTAIMGFVIGHSIKEDLITPEQDKHGNGG